MSSAYKNLNRLTKIRKDKKMTLIIGAKFKNGAVLVSDRKVTDGSEKSVYENKLIRCAIDIPIVFGAAGYRHKFKQFNRKIIEKMEESLRKIKIDNISYLKRRGLDYSKDMKEVKVEKLSDKDIITFESKKGNEDANPIPPPFEYTNEKFIEDCCNLIYKICEKEARLDVLLIRFAKEPLVHHINFLGDEEEVNYHAIGSGSSYANKFLGDFWHKDMDIIEILALAFFCIYYVQDLGFDSGVGVELGKLPDHKIILHDGRLGELDGIDIPTLISKIQTEIGKFKEIIDSLEFKKK